MIPVLIIPGYAWIGFLIVLGTGLIGIILIYLIDYLDRKGGIRQ